MRSRYLIGTILALLWLVVATVYIWAAMAQKDRVNLSATAGGQYPYLACADAIAVKGGTEIFGDHNRMPLIPTALSLVHDKNWEKFVDNSSWFAIGSSVVVLIGVGILSYLTLSVWLASALTLATVVCVFIYNASFVQAELTYYGLLFASWLVLCRVLIKPHTGWAALGGIIVGVTYLTKGAALPIIPAFLVPMCIKIIVLAWARRRSFAQHAYLPERPRPGSAILSALAVVLAFLIVVFPYIWNNKSHFDSYFYNVNSTFFVWCDSWSQAKSFADEYQIDQRFPDALPEKIPSAANYWRTHTPRQMFNRLSYGVKTLWTLALEQPAFKYFAVTVAFAGVLGVTRRRQVTDICKEYWAVAVFCALFFGGYLLAFAWYALVAYGERFLLSLFLPALFVVLWVGERLSRTSRPLLVFERKVLRSDALAIGLILWLGGEGLLTATLTLYQPSKAFVQFYYNETRELQLAGNLDEAERGFMGVKQLDEKYAPARHELGIVLLRKGKIDGAITELSIAVHLDPQVAAMRNSLGGALAQAGRTEEAIRELKQATQLDPNFAMAWYNLGGTYCLTGALDLAEDARKRLEALDSRLATKLADLIKSQDAD